MISKYLIGISFYQQREASYLMTLLSSLERYKENTVVIENIDPLKKTALGSLNHYVMRNANVGMNIGAWNRVFIERPDLDIYIFLQDECFLKKHGFLEHVTTRFNRESDLGMLGESINYKWARPWRELSKSALNTLEFDHPTFGLPSKRVDFYQKTMLSWGISPGLTAEHLRSLVWVFKGSVLRRLGGFPIGRNKGECIASEIAVSRKVVEMGYRFDQITSTPFAYFGHAEWQSNGVSKRLGKRENVV